MNGIALLDPVGVSTLEQLEAQQKLLTAQIESLRKAQRERELAENAEKRAREKAALAEKRAREAAENALKNEVKTWYLPVFLGLQSDDIGMILQSPDRLSFHVASYRYLVKTLQTSDRDTLFQVWWTIRTSPSKKREWGSVEERWTVPRATTPERNKKSSKDGNYISVTDMVEPIKSEMSLFFQKWLDAYPQWGQSTWRQVINTIITVWNSAHPESRLYKYTHKLSGDTVSIWSEIYWVYSQSDFSRVFGVVFPNWLETKMNRKAQTVKRDPQEGIKAWKVDLPQAGWTPSSEETGRNKIVRSRNMIEKVALANTVILNALTEYRKRRMQPWAASSFSPVIHNTEDANYTFWEVGRTVTITIHDITIDQFPIWKGLISNDGKEELRKAGNRATSWSIWKYDDEKNKIIALFPDSTVLEIQLPDLKGRPPKKGGQDAPVAKSIDALDHDTLSRTQTKFHVAIREYLSWYFDTYSTLRKIKLPKEDFIMLSIGRFRKRIEDDGSIIFDYDFTGLQTILSSQMEALHKIDDLQLYIWERGVKSLSVQTVEEKNPVRILFHPASTPLLSIVFSPYNSR